MRKKLSQFTTWEMDNNGKRGLQTTYMVRSLNEEIFLDFKDDIRRIFRPLNN